MSAPKFGGLKIQKKKDAPGLSKPGKPEAKRSIFYDPLEEGDDDESEVIEPVQGDRKLKLPTRARPGDDSIARNRVNTEIVAQSLRNSEVAAIHEVEDASIYAYDEVYDTMKAAERSVRAELTGDGEKNRERKSKYIATLQESTKTRTQDRLMARDSLNKRERDEEGDEFEGTLVFESAAFKKQKAEIEKLKKEEELKEERERKNKKRGLSSIYHKVLSQAENTHDAQIRAAAAAAAAAAAKAPTKQE